MKKLRVSILFAMLLLLMLVPMIKPPQRVKALGHEKYYTVRGGAYGGIGPVLPTGNVLGEWFVDCYGNWYGWGCKPSECNNTYTEVVLGDVCVS